MDAWSECTGTASWAGEALRDTLKYPSPLPVQQAVIPTVARALLSGIPMDVSLTAPTGSGKTLCYLLPALRVITESKRGADDTQLRVLILVPTRALGQQVYREILQLTRNTSIAATTLCVETASVREEAQQLVRSVRVPQAGTLFARYYSKTDILVATPQRLLRHLDGTEGLSLAALRLLVIDEADQVLAGNFANFVAKVVERNEEEHMRQQEAEMCTSGVFPSLISSSTAAKQAAGTLHKILCSATLSSRISRISEVRLRNCRYFALDSEGQELAGGEGIEVAAAASTSAASARGGSGCLVKTAFPLPPTLQEHVVFVEDAYRHAVLLKLVRTLLLKIEQTQQRNKAKQSAEAERLADEEAGNEEGDKDEAKAGTGTSTSVASADEDPAQYPQTNDMAGTGILVFCSSAEEARVMGHFLSAAGVKGVVEFTTLATEAERRRALLTPSSCVVASDALMRGIDIPNVGHVIMYHAPDSISQYVHRAGRTARAMRAGHVHLLLSKTGASGELGDGEVARYKELGAQVAHTLPPRYERHFFMFAKAPMSAKQQEKLEKKQEGDAAAAAAVAETEARHTRGTAEWWCAEANRFLAQSQHQLQSNWASALEQALAAVPARQKAKATATAAAVPAGSREGKTTNTAGKQQQPPRGGTRAGQKRYRSH